MQIECYDALGNRYPHQTVAAPTPTGVRARIDGLRGVYFFRVTGAGQRGETVRAVKVE